MTNDEINSKIIAISEHIGNKGGLKDLFFGLSVSATLDASTHDTIYIIFEGCLRVAKYIAGFDVKDDVTSYMNDGSYQKFLNILQTGENVTVQSGVSVNLMPYLAQAAGGEILINIVSLFSNNNIAQERVQLLKQKTEQCIQLFYDFLDTYKKYNPSFDTSPYLPKPKPTVNTLVTPLTNGNNGTGNNPNDQKTDYTFVYIGGFVFFSILILLIIKKVRG